MVTLLSADRAAGLASASYTYREVGATAGTLPRSYVHLVRHVTHDADAFDSMAERLMTWQVHEDAGLGVVASAGRVQADAVVELRIGPPPLQVRAPCRVVYVVDEPDRVGFAYGTLDGHPERGEESFSSNASPAKHGSRSSPSHVRPPRSPGPVVRSPVWCRTGSPSATCVHPPTVSRPLERFAAPIDSHPAPRRAFWRQRSYGEACAGSW